METNKWVKIGETHQEPSGPFTREGIYHVYAIFELIKSNGMRKYKRVFMASGHSMPKLNSQPV